MTTDATDPTSTAPQSDWTAAETPSALQVTDQTLDTIKRNEALMLHADFVWGDELAIGYGHTGDVKEDDHITQQDAQKLLEQDVAQAAQTVRDHVSAPLTQAQFDALTSFAYNEGEAAFDKSDLPEKLNAGDYDGALAEFDRMAEEGHLSGGDPIRQVGRREEADLFDRGTLADVAEAPSAQNPQTQPDDGAQTHTVISGDTLWDIAEDHKVSLDALIAANPQFAANPDLIFPGQQVTIPSAQDLAGAATTEPASPVAESQLLNADDNSSGYKDYASTFVDSGQTNNFPGWYQKRWDTPATEADREKIEQHADQVGLNFVPLDLDG